MMKNINNEILGGLAITGLLAVFIVLSCAGKVTTERTTGQWLIDPDK